MFGQQVRPGATAALNVWVLVLYFTGFCTLSASVLAGEPYPAAESLAVPSSLRTEQRFGTVWLIRGEVTAGPGDSVAKRLLREGDPVYVGETVQATNVSEAVLRTEDLGVLAIRPGAKVIVERFVAEGRRTDQFLLRLVTGGLRIITGWIGRTNRADHRVVTATATIGIRGTDHEPFAMPPGLADTLNQNAGTYNKVNRGSTTIEANGNRVDVDPGRVGFAPAVSKIRLRGLLTVLLPTLLDSIPDFFVPGEFDEELDRLSTAIEADALRALKERGWTDVDPPTDAPPVPPEHTSDVPDTPQPSTATVPPQITGSTNKPVTDPCDADAIAREWLTAFDAAVMQRAAQAMLRLFSNDAVIRANIRQSDGSIVSVDFNRNQLAQSAIAAMERLTEYQQRRPSTEAFVVDADSRQCRRIRVRSLNIEQGRQAGQPYRFEALEEYMLEQRDGVWYAVSAVTTQR